MGAREFLLIKEVPKKNVFINPTISLFQSNHDI
jgi:hypothetical protein